MVNDETIGNVIGVFLLISIISLISVTIAVIILGTGNDYGVGTLYDIEQNLYDDGIITDTRVTEITEESNQVLLTWIEQIDNLWLLAYVIVSILLFTSAYFATRMSFFTFNNMLYVGILFFLFVLDFITIINNWLYEEFLLNVFPLAVTVLPKFLYFLNNLPIILSIQIAICLFLNIVDFDFILSSIRKNKEKEVLSSSDEVL